jgi:hypothetical protein
VGVSARKPIDWTEIETEYRSILELLDEIRLPSTDEIDCYKASLAAPGLVVSDLPARLRLGNRYPLLQGDDRILMLDQILEILGLGNTDLLPAYMRQHVRDHLGIVGHATANKELSLDFVFSWGEIQKAIGGVIALLIGDEAAHKNFIRGQNAGAKSNGATLQRYWYAWWLEKGGLFEKYDNRLSLNDELYELCFDIYRERREAVLYDVEWFRSMIYLPNEDKRPLKGNKRRERGLSRLLIDLPEDEIKRMIANPLIPLDALPPLLPDAFPEISAGKP